MKRFAVGLALMVLAVSMAAGAQQLGTKSALPTEIGGDENVYTSGGGRGNGCWGGYPQASVSIEGDPVAVVAARVTGSCSGVSPTYCADALCPMAYSNADAMCHGNKACNGDCAADQVLLPDNGDCLVYCLSVTVAGRCERVGPSDPFKK